jgi:hypothetical protein
MGLNRRKKSGNIIGGSRLIVDGQPIFSVKKYVPDIKKISLKDNFTEGAETPTPTTTTTTTIPVQTCNLETQQLNNLVTQDYFNLVLC